MTRFIEDGALYLPGSYTVVAVTQRMCVIVLLRKTEEQLEKGLRPHPLDDRKLLVEGTSAVKFDGTHALTIVPMKKGLPWRKTVAYELQLGGKKVAEATDETETGFAENVALVHTMFQEHPHQQVHLALVKTATQ